MFFWEKRDTIFAIKINQYNLFKSEFQERRVSDGYLSFAEIFDFIDFNHAKVKDWKIRPTDSDLIDSSSVSVFKGDTSYLIMAFNCTDCQSYRLTVDFNGTVNEMYWQSIAMEKKNKYYYQNLDSKAYHLALLLLRNIEHYDRNLFWEKEKNGR